MLDGQGVLAQILDEHLILVIILVLAHLNYHVLLWVLRFATRALAGQLALGDSVVPLLLIALAIRR